MHDTVALSDWIVSMNPGREYLFQGHAYEHMSKRHEV